MRARGTAFLLVSAVVLTVIAFPVAVALAGPPTAVNARVVRMGEDRYQFEVNIAHDDTSWDHFVDRWEVVGDGGKILATDYMYYPRTGEGTVWQVLRGIKVDPGTKYVIYRLHAKGEGYGRDKLVRMPAPGQKDTGWQ